MPDRRQFLSAAASALALGPLALWASRGGRTDAPISAAAVFPDTRTPDEWRRILTPEQFRVLRAHATEPPFSSHLHDEKRDGTFVCAGCGHPLFSSAAKYDSGTGWPSFWTTLKDAVGTSVDRSYFMVRTEVHCAACGGHLGHLFPDGPAPTGERYCINGVAMRFLPGA